MNLTIVVGLVFAILLGFEWRYRLRSLRVGTALLAVVALYVAEPIPYRAVRRSLLMPPAQRIAQQPGWHQLSEYEVGVFTMQQAVIRDTEVGANARALAVGVLFWLACSPVLRDRHRLLDEGISKAGPVPPEA